MSFRQGESREDPKMVPKPHRVFPLTKNQFEGLLIFLGYVFSTYGMFSTYATVFTYNGIHTEWWMYVWFGVGFMYDLIMTILITTIYFVGLKEYLEEKTRLRFKDPNKDRKYD